MNLKNSQVATSGAESYAGIVVGSFRGNLSNIHLEKNAVSTTGSKAHAGLISGEGRGTIINGTLLDSTVVTSGENARAQLSFGLHVGHDQQNNIVANNMTTQARPPLIEHPPLAPATPPAPAFLPLPVSPALFEAPVINVTSSLGVAGSLLGGVALGLTMCFTGLWLYKKFTNEHKKEAREEVASDIDEPLDLQGKIDLKIEADLEIVADLEIEGIEMFVIQNKNKEKIKSKEEIIIEIGSESLKRSLLGSEKRSNESETRRRHKRGDYSKVKQEDSSDEEKEV